MPEYTVNKFEIQPRPWPIFMTAPQPGPYRGKSGIPGQAWSPSLSLFFGSQPVLKT